MRFLSLDQKPSWFCNAGNIGTFSQKGGCQPSVRENHAKTRERYTILTAVPSWGQGGPGEPPKMCVLFKAAPNGSVLKKLQTYAGLRPWTKVQTQEYGSYRSGDMVEALEWMLPDCNHPSESIVVVLDWYRGHLTEEVADVIRRKGHVLLFHGGGCTPYTQVNDTHFHASLARILVQMENEWALSELERFEEMGVKKVPTLTREDIISMAQMAWASLDHGQLAPKAYLQTGPNMPLEGDVRYEDVFHDLRRVLEAIGRDAGRTWEPEFIDMGIRDAAVAFVRQGHAAGRWANDWKVCAELIEEHTDVQEAMEEGQEVFGIEPVYEDVEEDEEHESDTDEGGDGGGEKRSISEEDHNVDADVAFPEDWPAPMEA